MNPRVDTFLDQSLQWTEEMIQLRIILLDCGLFEDFKWANPCYTIDKGIVLLLSPFKHYCALNFFKGSLLSDTEDLLVQPGENSQSGRQMRFTSVEQIHALQPIIKAYIHEAIEIEKAGLKVTPKKLEDYTFPEELRQKLDENPDLNAAFESLTPGRQKAYLLYFSDAKQSVTRMARIEKNMHRILAGKGIHGCVCGKSKRMPRCDGSHKHID